MIEQHTTHRAKQIMQIVSMSALTNLWVHKPISHWKNIVTSAPRNMLCKSLLGE